MRKSIDVKGKIWGNQLRLNAGKLWCGGIVRCTECCLHTTYLSLSSTIIRELAVFVRLNVGGVVDRILVSVPPFVITDIVTDSTPTSEPTGATRLQRNEYMESV